MRLNSPKAGLPLYKRFIKRTIDIIASILCLILIGWIVLLAFIAASIDTGKNGFFTQARVGKRGRLFNLIKIRTMRDSRYINTTVTVSGDQRITLLGSFFRKTKIDEFPQIINVLFGQMSLVGPRPDVPGFADKLTGDDRIILSINPGITGPATLKYRHEEELLKQQPDPETFNQKIIFPDKVRLNREYVENYSLLKDIKYIYQTIFGPE